MTKQIFIYIISCTLITACTKSDEIQEFTFVRTIGTDYGTTKYTSRALWFMSLDWPNDQMLLEFSMIYEIDQQDTLPNPIYSLKIPNNIKTLVTDFVQYSRSMPNGLIDNAKFDEPEMYSGGTYIISYKDKRGTSHSFKYQLTNLSRTTSNLHHALNEIFCNEPKYSEHKTNLTLNTDSITTKLAGLVGITHLPLNFYDPIKFVPYDDSSDMQK